MPEEQELTKAIFEKINGLMEGKGLFSPIGNDRGCDDHCCAELDEERDREP